LQMFTVTCWNACHCTCGEEKAPVKCEVHRSLWKSASSIYYLIPVIKLAPGILGLLLVFWTTCAPCISSAICFKNHKVNFRT
jgi:hypothetical protein